MNAITDLFSMPGRRDSAAIRDHLAAEVQREVQEYRAARALVESSEWRASVEDVLTRLDAFAPGMSGDMAIAVLAEARILAQQVMRPVAFIRAHEAKVKTFNEMSS